MRIVHVILAFYPCNIWGGPPQNTYNLVKGLQARGHQVEILTTNILDYRNRMSEQTIQKEWKGISVTYLNTYWFGKRSNSLGFIFVPALFRFRYIIKQADIVHIQGYRHFLFTFVSLLAKLYGVPYIVQPRGSLTHHLGRSGLKRLYDKVLGKFLLKGAAGGVALSDEETQQFIAQGVHPNNIRKILNPFDPNICSNLPSGKLFREKHGIAEHESVVLFLSRIHEKKGLDLLVEAFAKLNRPDVRLCVVGPDDGHLSKVKQLAEDLGVFSSILFVGPLYGQDKFSAYCASDIYVLPTRGYEGLPTVILEAAYAGLPIIVTKNTEIADLINGVAGISIDYNVDELVKALETLLDNVSLREEYGKSAKNLIREQFNIEEALDRFESFYSSV